MLESGEKSDLESEEEDQESTNKDPTKAYVMCIYERSDGETLNLKRSITLSGSSEYRINGRVVSASEYANVLKKENILIKARNFLVFQGDVEQIASQSPTDLTKLIETISGSIEYKKDLDFLKDEQESANEKTKSIFSSRRTLNAELKQYKEQCLELELFENKLKERINLIKLSKMYQLYHTDQEIDSLESKLLTLQSELKSLKSDLKNEESSFRKVSVEYAKYELSLNKYNKKISTKSKELELKQRDLIPLNTEKSLLTNKLNDYELRIREISKEIQRQDENIHDFSKQLHSVEEAKKVFETRLQLETAIRLSPDALKQYQELRELFLIKGGAEQEKVLNNLNRELELLESQLMNHETTRDATGDILKNLEYDINDSTKKLNELTNNLNNNLDNLQLQKQEIAKIKDMKREFLEKEFQLNSKLKEVLIQINDLNANQRESNRERKLRENVSTLKRLFPGVKGLVSDLCRPTQKRFELAVSTVLGKNFDSIVVDNISVASKCIEYLKEQRAGVATFIPLDSVDSKPPASHLRQIHELARPSIDCIEYDSYMERAVQYCCGNSMICDDMRIAKHIRWERNIDVKVVSLDGSLIHKAGLMTGGQSKNEGRKFNKNDLNNLQDMKLDLVKQIEDLAKEIPSEAAEKKLMLEIDRLEEDLNQIRRQRLQLQRELDDKESHRRIQKETLDSNEQKIQNLELQIKTKSQEISEHQSMMSVLQQEIYSQFCLENELSSINEYEKSFKNSLKYKQKTQFLKQINILQNKLTFEKERFEESKSRLERLDKEKIRIDEKLTTISNDLQSQMESVEFVESEIELLREDLEKFELNYLNHFKQSSVSNTKLEELKSELSMKKTQIDDLNEDLLKELSLKLQILKNCKIENVNIPLETGSMSDIPIEIVAEDDDEEKELLNFAKKVMIAYDELPRKYHENSSELTRELQEKIESLQQELEQLTPNTKAVERLREVELKLADIEKEFKQSRKDEQKVVNKFNELKQKRYLKFNEAFEHISHNINDIYKEITKSPVSPLGGSLYLTLEDEDEPYNAGIKYHAMPPMKRFRDMELLSGGEKTMAALALLFAIHSYHPSPFFVLDEVDAALDNSNVNRLANYIRNNCNENFQFIVISLKNSLFEKSDSLIGIFRNQSENSSKTVTLDLRSYPETA